MRTRTLRIASHLTLLTAALAGAALESEGVAYALQGGEDPALLPVLVDKRYGSAGRLQLSASFSTAIVTKFVEGTGAYLTGGYSFSDLLGIELGGGYFATKESSITDAVRDKFKPLDPPLTDLYQLNWLVNASVVLVPLYGKMSFASEIDPSFDLFVVAGGGLAGVRRKTVIFPVGSGDPVIDYDKKTAPTFHGGLGFRFYFNRLLALRLELRDFFYPDQGKDETGKSLGGFTSELHFQGGLQLAFGGED